MAKISLPQVTLFGVDAHNPEGLLKASEICQRHIEFGEVKMITERLFWGREGYSEFCIRHMSKFIDTPYVLIIHADSWVLNPSAWDDAWLQYDYIGAPWPYPTRAVGNGGFSLRSKKLLDVLSQQQWDEYHPEDDIICRKHGKWLEDTHGIRFAPRHVAEIFSIEACGGGVYRGQFGWHGVNIDFSALPESERPY
jgi:hypothetical protein